MGLFSSSKSKSTVQNSTDIDTVTTSSATGNAFGLGANSSFRGEVGLTGQQASDVILGFTEGAIEIERLRASSFLNAQVTGDSRSGGGGSFIAGLPTNKKPKKFDFKNNIPLIAGGVVIASFVFLRLRT